MSEPNGAKQWLSEFLLSAEKQHVIKSKSNKAMKKRKRKISHS